MFWVNEIAKASALKTVTVFFLAYSGNAPTFPDFLLGSVVKKDFSHIGVFILK